jgi:hypothetical protein
MLVPVEAAATIVAAMRAAHNDAEDVRQDMAVLLLEAKTLRDTRTTAFKLSRRASPRQQVVTAGGPPITRTDDAVPTESKTDVFPQLHDAMHNFAKRVIANLTFPLPFKQVMVHQFQDDGRAYGSAIVVVDSHSALGNIWNTWPELMEFRQVIEAARADDRTVRALLSDAAGKPTEPAETAASNCLRFFMADYLNAAWEQRSFGWLPDVFENLYGTFTDSIARGSARIIEWCPVHQLTASGLKLPQSIHSGCELVEPSQTERMDLDESGPAFGSGLAFPARFYLKAPSFAGFGQPTGLGMLESFGAGTAAIRVAVGGDARPGQVAIVVGRGECHAMGIYSGGRYGWPDRSVGIPSVLTQSDIADVQQYADRWGHLKSEFPLVAGRFEGLPSRLSLDDKLVDAMVGLEGLLVPEGSVTELSFRFALRGSWLLGGTDPVARHVWFGRLKSAYDVRSKMLHADARSMRKLPPERMSVAAETSQEALRLIFQELLATGMSQQSWSKRVVDVVFG